MSLAITGAQCKQCRRTFTAKQVPGSNNLLFEDYCHRCAEKNIDFETFLTIAGEHDPLTKVKDRIAAQERLEQEKSYARVAAYELDLLAAAAKNKPDNRIFVSDSEFTRYVSLLLTTYEGKNELCWCRTYFTYRGAIVVTARASELS